MTNNNDSRKVKYPFRGDYSHYPSELMDGVCIPLTQGRHTVIDADDYVKAENYLWFYEKGYACSKRAGYLHRLVNNTPHGSQTDHINGVTLDNRKKNLRSCTCAENQWNSKPYKVAKSNFKGVSPHSSGKYMATIRQDGKLRHLGLFNTAEEAAKEYDRAALSIRGDFAKINFMEAANG